MTRTRVSAGEIFKSTDLRKCGISQKETVGGVACRREQSQNKLSSFDCALAGVSVSSKTVGWGAARRRWDLRFRPMFY